MLVSIQSDMTDSDIQVCDYYSAIEYLRQKVLKVMVVNPTNIPIKVLERILQALEHHKSGEITCHELFMQFYSCGLLKHILAVAEFFSDDVEEFVCDYDTAHEYLRIKLTKIMHEACSQEDAEILKSLLRELRLHREKKVTDTACFLKFYEFGLHHHLEPVAEYLGLDDFFDIPADNQSDIHSESESESEPDFQFLDGEY